MKNSSIQPVLIVGGGIGGLTLAIALARLGIHTQIFEKAPELREIGAAIALWPNATHILRDIGILDPLLEQSALITDCEIRNWKGDRVKQWQIPHLDTPAVFVARADLQSILASALPADTIQLGQSARRFEESDKEVTLYSDSGDHATSQVLVGADGLHSAIRAQLLGYSETVYQGYTTWRAIVNGVHEVLRPGMKIEWWGHGVRFGIAANGRGRMNWYVSANRPAPETSVGSKARLLEWVHNWQTPVEEIILATPDQAILKTDIQTRPPLKAWGQGRVTLLGDAAHPTSPNLGQGAGMAIEDAGCLAHCLSQSNDLVVALRCYENLRKRRATSTIKRSRLVGWVGQWNHPALVVARTTFLRAIPIFLWERQLKSLYSYRIDRT